MIAQIPSSDLVWQNDISSFYFESSTLLLSVFHIDPMLDTEETLHQLQKAYKALHLRLRPWIKHYIWDSEPPKIEIVEYNGVNYIYGELRFGDSVDDQWLLTHILFEFSKSYPDLYIHIRDNEGEYLLIECHEQIPNWLGPENDTNRDWINHGRVLIISQEYYQDRGLKMTEALNFLERAIYKCSNIPEVDDHIKRKLDAYPIKALELQCEIEVRVPRRIASLIMKKNMLNHAVLKYAKDNAIIREPEQTIEEAVDLRVRTTVITFLFIDFYLKTHELADFKKDGGKFVTASIESYDIDFEVDLCTNEEIKKYNQQGDVLQDELIRLLRIPKRVDPKISFEKPENPNLNESDLMEKLRDFFKDTEAGLDGVENKKKKENTQFLETERLEQTDDENSVENTKEFLTKNGLDIDEDDFFEFFAKEALKLSDDDLKKFRNMNLEEPPASSDEDLEDDDYDEKSDPEISSEDLKSLAEMLQSFKDSDGPAAAFLNNLNGAI